jgi:hypothetical protein
MSDLKNKLDEFEAKLIKFQFRTSRRLAFVFIEN